MNSLPPGFTKKELTGFSPAQAFLYTGVVLGAKLDILEVNYKVVDYSLYVGKELIFAGLREDQAKIEIQKFVKELQADNELP